MNEDELVKQWTNVWGTDQTADETETIGNTTRTAYKNGSAVVLEAFKVTGMGHATAVGDDANGTCVSTAGSYFENKGICSTFRAANGSRWSKRTGCSSASEHRSRPSPTAPKSCPA